MNATPLLLSPLDDRHRALGATMASFGGWSMPLSYPGGGVVAEHHAVRNAVGLFDVSHLGKASVAGPGSADFVNRCLTADLGRIGPGQAQYTMCGNASGGVVDDMIAYLENPESVFLIPNAANAAAVVAALWDAAPSEIVITDRHPEFAVLAVQGPRSAEALRVVGLPSDLDYMAWRDVGDFGGTRVCRTGYTGEHGYELVIPTAAAAAAWDQLLEAVTGLEGKPAGLGARDTLRTELGYPLHGQDLSPEISPLQARAGWAVGWKKPEFFGRDAMLAEKAAGPARLLWGLKAIDKGVIRPHLPVLSVDGAPIGTTTSGTFSPTLGVGIGLALVDAEAEAEAGTECVVSVRGRSLRAELRRPPFVPSHVR